MKLLYKKSFTKSYQVLGHKMRDKVKGVLQIFMLNPMDKELRNHGLEGKYKGKRSIDVTGDIRIIFKEISDGKYELVEIYDVGTHAQLYK
ncbi:MAG: type II toxin-antitoxin system mRNA interferase toxin, RelE/StbE family [Candidatus Absconditabacterales bacterium]